jgi:methylated-DNA-protein-cysteine methyltransferase-like protein
MGYDPERHGPHRVVGPGLHARVFALVARVPKGSVTTYGDIAAALGLRSAARQVGYALAALTDSHGDVPWHRVVNGQGRVTFPPGSERAAEQRRRLARERVVVRANGAVERFAALRFSFDGDDSA